MTPTRGGDWLIHDVTAAHTFTPEHLSEDHRLVRQTAAEFVTNEVLPSLEDLERKDWSRARHLVKRAADLGLVGTDVPDRFGGIGLDKAASILVTEEIGACAAFAATFGAQTGLALIPILCFGTPEQQQRYLPRLVSGEIIGAYCLSESGSGSDALGARARAVKQSDDSWLLNGEKMWVTNGGFADIFIVFAKVNGEQFSAFIVERGFPGVTIGKEEHKLGLLGSSTTPLVMSDARVPAANLLGEVGKGHKIAFNVLNYGRFKLAAMCTGGARVALAEAAAYANGRRQFNRPIASFGAIRHKLAEMAIRLYGVESMLYRTAGLIDRSVDHGGDDAGVVAAALEEFAIESSLLKIASSEMVWFVADENVQIHGGNGFVSDYGAERHYRDVRVDRIFEGTNEINRMLVPGMLVKRAAKGGAQVLEAARALHSSLRSKAHESHAAGGNSPLVDARRTVTSMKKAALLTLGFAVDTYGEKLGDEQEVAMLAADVILETFAAESALLRAESAHASGDKAAHLHEDAASVLAHDAGLRAESAARVAINAMATGETLDSMRAMLAQVLHVIPVNTVASRRRIADAVSAKAKYCFLG